MTDIKIRACRESDFKRVFEIWIQNQFQASQKRVDPAELGALQADFSNVYFNPINPRSFVAVSSSEVIGWYALMPLLSNPLFKNAAVQTSIYVDQNFFSRSVGTRLLEHAIREARETGIDHMYGWIRRDNPIANKLLEKCNTHQFFIPASKRKNMPDFNLYVIAL
jgi:L-amino acid N-acyltransferase YncA